MVVLANKTISLVIPAHNESKRIGSFLESNLLYCQSGHKIDEIIVVDDGSTDGTAELVSVFDGRLPISVLRLENNQGKGAAVRAGIMAARSDLVIFMDADGATPITELPKMLEALKGYQIGIGNRWMKGAITERHSTMRKISGWVYRHYMGLFGLGAIDTMCGFKGYHREVAVKLFANLLEKRWLFDTEIAYKAVRHGYTIKNFPIFWTSQDGSKLDTKTLLKSAFRIWPLILEIKKIENKNMAISN